MPRRCERRTLPIELIPHGYVQKIRWLGNCERFVRIPLPFSNANLSPSNGWVAEWSKALVLGTSLSGGVGSNPTPVTIFAGFPWPMRR